MSNYTILSACIDRGEYRLAHEYTHSTDFDQLIRCAVADALNEKSADSSIAIFGRIARRVTKIVLGLFGAALAARNAVHIASIAVGVVKGLASIMGLVGFMGASQGITAAAVTALTYASIIGLSLLIPLVFGGLGVAMARWAWRGELSKAMRDLKSLNGLKARITYIANWLGGKNKAELKQLKQSLQATIKRESKK